MKKFAATYLPRPELIPAILLIGGVGAIVVMKALPKVSAWIAQKTPQIQASPAAA